MFAFVFTAAVLVSSTLATPFHSCSGGQSPVEVRVEGCSALPCVFEHGTTVHAEVDFKAPHGVSHMKPDVIATVFGVPVPYPLPEQNACNSLVGSACPLEEGDLATYLLELPINNLIPSIDNINVQLSIKDTDANNEVLSCFSVDLSVK